MQTLTLLNNSIQIERKTVKFPAIYLHFFRFEQILHPQT